MSRNNDTATGIVELKDLRLACKQFARLYFNLCKTLRDALGEETAFSLTQKTVFNLSLDRTDKAREQAAIRGLETTLENFAAVNDLPAIGWSGWKQEMGGVRCPYAEVWLEYFNDN